MGNTKHKIYNYIKQYNEENGSYPTLKNICENTGLSAVSTVHNHIKGLMELGLLDKDEFGGFKLSENVKYKNKVPIIGIITAGLPIEAIEDKMEYVAVSDLPEGDFYALKVRGDSMIEDGIFDGDTVVIKRQSSADNGQTVVAIVDDNKTTLKKIYREKDKIRLQPANQSMLPLYYDEVEIRGVVWSIIRDIHEVNAKAENSKKLKTVDLFAGVGGIRLGFEQNGFETVFANDFEPKCEPTYNANFKTSKLIVEDITKIPVDDIPECDFIMGGFPCQAFSIAGYRQGFNDEKGRGNLFFNIAEIIKKKQPIGFLLENVKNLKSHDNGRTFKVIEKTLSELGYHIKAKILNSMEYGNVPQNRERIYIVGFKDKEKIERFEFPKPIKLTKSVSDILEDDVEPKYYYDGKPLFEKLKNDVTEEGSVYQWRRVYVRKNKKGVCPTLTANMGTGGHNVPIVYDGKGIRKLTPRECFRLQGFPDDYKLPNIADSALYKQAGNSVSVPVIRRIAEQIAQVL